MGITENVHQKITEEENEADYEIHFQNLGTGSSILRAKCNICGKILPDKENCQYFAEDGSYLCSECQIKYFGGIKI